MHGDTSLGTPIERKITKLSAQACEAFLYDDARLISWFLGKMRNIRFSRGAASLTSCNPARKSKSGINDSVDWWKAAPDRPPLLIKRLLEPINAGFQPITGTMSLYLAGSAPTLYLPVPFRMDSSASNALRTLWGSESECGPTLTDDRPEDEVILRQFSHALANIAYGVRVGDSPHYGWIARAHDTGQTIYIPDVHRVVDEPKATSAVLDTEPFLGMASVLYVPMQLPPNKTPYAQASISSPVVFVFWSPVPHRWDHLFEEIKDISEAVIDPRWIAPPVDMNEEFASIERELSKEAKAQAGMEAQILSLFLAMRRWSEDLGTRLHLEFWAKFAHGTLALLSASLAEDSSDHPAVQNWLRFLLDEESGFQTSLEAAWRRKIGEVRFTCRLRGKEEPPKEATLATAENVISQIPRTVRLSVASKVATQFISEARLNLEKYGSSLASVDVDISQKYCGIRLVFQPKRQYRLRLYGSADAFRRYYAMRRGVMIEPAGRASYGIGLGIHGVLGGHLGIYSRLYVSPDGKDWWHDTAFPLERKEA